MAIETTKPASVAVNIAAMLMVTVTSAGQVIRSVVAIATTGFAVAMSVHTYRDRLTHIAAFLWSAT